MAPLQAFPLTHPASRPEPHASWHWYSHRFCVLQTHSPGHRMGAFIAGQSQVA